MADVFLSYAREDRDRAELLAHALESRGCSVWWDRRIQAGHVFADVIEKQLEAARCVVVLWTEHSIASTWVQNEASEGDHRTILIPVRLDDVRIPLGFRHLQTADLLDWDGEETPELADFLSAVESKIGKPPAAAPAATLPPPRARKSRVGLIAAISVAAIALLGVLIAIAAKKASLFNQNTASTETVLVTTQDTANTATAPVTDATGTTATVDTATTSTPETTTTTTGTVSPPVQKTYVELDTSAGTILIECFTDRAPQHVRYFTALAGRGRYDGVSFDRVLPSMTIQTAAGGTAVSLAAESSDAAYQPGMVGFTYEPDKVTGQFFVWLSTRPPSNKKYSWFGRVVRGLDVAEKISRTQVGRDRKPLKSAVIRKATVRTR